MRIDTGIDNRILNIFIVSSGGFIQYGMDIKTPSIVNRRIAITSKIVIIYTPFLTVYRIIWIISS